MNSELVDEQRGERAEDLQSNFEYNEDAIADTGQTGTRSREQISGNKGRALGNCEAIELTEIFDDRSIEPAGPPKKIHRVLIFGNPGCGKSSIARKIAYCWAQGTWGHRFESVFFLTVRELTGNNFDDSTNRRRRTLECATARLCFQRVKDNEYDMLTTMIGDALQRETTLLILDGLDEADAVGNEMIRASVKLPCMILLLSRPFDIREIGQDIQIELECLGMTSKQLYAYVSSVLSPQRSQSLMLYFLKNPGIEELARVPVIASIMCYLWTEESIEAEARSLTSIYGMITEHLWRRFVAKHPYHRATREDVFEALGRIGLEMDQSDADLISQHILTEHSTDEMPESIFGQLGFLLSSWEGQHYRFAHLSFQKYFAAMCLAEDLFSDNDAKSRAAKSFVLFSRFSVRHEEILRFLNEEVCHRRGYSGFMKLRQIAAEDLEPGRDLESLLFDLELIDAFLASSNGSTDAARSNAVDSRVIEGVIALLKDFDENEQRLPLVFQKLSRLAAAVRHSPSLFLHLLECVKKRNNPFRGDALNAMLRLFPAVPERADSVLTVLSHLYSEEKADETLRAQALSQLRILGRLIPEERIDEVLVLLKAGCRDESDAVRAQAQSQLVVLAGAGPRVCNRIMAAVEELCLEQHPKVRDDGWILLCEIEKESPEHDYDVLELAKRACDPEDEKTKTGSVRRLFKLAKSSPNFQARILEHLKDLSFHQSMDVRLEVFSELYICLQESQDFAKKALELLEWGLQDGSSSVRAEVYSHLQSISQAKPEHCEALLTTLEPLCRHESVDVRADAARHLSGFAEALSEYLERFMKLVESLCEDRSRDVRVALVDHMDELVRCFPNRKHTILRQMRHACPDEIIPIVTDKVKNDSPEVRMSWAGLLGDLAKEMPVHVDVLWTSSEELLEDDIAAVRMKAVSSCVQIADSSYHYARSFLKTVLGVIESFSDYALSFLDALRSIERQGFIAEHRWKEWTLDPNKPLEALKKLLDISDSLLPTETPGSSGISHFSFVRNIEVGFLVLSLSKYGEPGYRKYSCKFDAMRAFIMTLCVREKGINGYRFFKGVFDEEPVEILGVQHTLKTLQLFEAAAQAVDINSDVYALIFNDKTSKGLKESINEFLVAAKFQLRANWFFESTVDFVQKQAHASRLIPSHTWGGERNSMCEYKRFSRTVTGASNQTGSEKSGTAPAKGETWKDNGVRSRVHNLLSTTGCALREEKSPSVERAVQTAARSNNKMICMRTMHLVPHVLETTSNKNEMTDIVSGCLGEGVKHGSEEVRGEAVLQISPAFKTLSEPFLLDFVETALDDDRESVRIRAVLQAFEILEHCPERKNDMWQCLAAKLEQSDEALKRHIVDHLGHTFHSLKPDDMKSAGDRLLELYEHAESNALRHSVVCTMSTIAKHLPDSHRRIELLLQRIAFAENEDENKRTRNEAELQLRFLNQRGYRIGEAPEFVQRQLEDRVPPSTASGPRVEDELNLLQQDCESKSDATRLEAMNRIPGHFRRATDSSALILELLHEGVGDPVDRVCIAAIQQLPQILEAVPEAVPEVGEEVADLLKRGFDADRKNVCIAAFQVLPRTLNRATEAAPGFVEFVQWGCRHGDHEIKSAAMQQIVPMLKIKSLDGDDVLLRLLCEGLKDKTEVVRSVATESLEGLQFKHLIRLFWEGKEDVLAFALSVKLLQVPLLLARNVGDLTVELTYTEAGECKRESKTLADVQHLLSTIHSQLRKRSPFLLEVLDFESVLKEWI